MIIRDQLLIEKQTHRCVTGTLYRVRFLLLTCVLLFAVQVNGQESYFSFKVSYPVIGTPRELKSGLREADFGNSTTVGFTQDFPYAVKYPSVVVEWGKYIKEKTSISVLAGLQEAGFVRGYNTNRGGIRFNYTNWVVNPKLNFHRSAAILGLGPSALLLTYNRHHDYQSDDYKPTRVLPGVSLSAETVAKKKKGYRMGFFSALNLHPSFDIEPALIRSNSQVTTFRSRLNPSSLLVGLRLQF